MPASLKLLLQVSFPFHDAEDDWIKVRYWLHLAQTRHTSLVSIYCVLQPEHIRRARVYDKHTREWSLITPGQTWRDGEVQSCQDLCTGPWSVPSMALRLNL